MAYLLLITKTVAHRQVFSFSTSPIYCSYFTWETAETWNLKSRKFHRKMRFWSKISVCQRDMVHENRWVKFLTRVGNLGASTVCWRVS